MESHCTCIKYIVNVGYIYKEPEGQKSVIAAQRCSVENQKGATAVQSQWQ